jgi:hypothetical protein
MEIERKYKTGYKPKVCLINLSLNYKNIKSKKIKSVNIKKIVAVLDDDYKFPTHNMKQLTIIRAWRQEGLGNIKDFTINITNIETISEHGRVNYKFDELIH